MDESRQISFIAERKKIGSLNGDNIRNTKKPRTKKNLETTKLKPQGHTKETAEKTEDCKLLRRSWLVHPWYERKRNQRRQSNIQVPHLRGLHRKKGNGSPTTEEGSIREYTRGSERLTEEAPWRVPPWGHRTIVTDGNDNLTEMSPRLVPPWIWETLETRLITQWKQRKED